MAIDIKNILEIVQTKIAAVGPSTSTEDLSYLLKLAKRLDGTTLVSYDSDGLLPDATTSNERLAFITSTGQVKFNNGAWDVIAATTPEPEPRGYTFYGYDDGYGIGGFPNTSHIDWFPFAADVNAVNVGNLSVQRGYAGATNSFTHGYTHGGFNALNVIDKFPFASNTDGATDVGDLPAGTHYASSASTEDYGYYGGGSAPSTTNTYGKFSHVSDGNGTNIGTLTVAKFLMGQGNSSDTNGYFTSGWPASYANHVEKFSFAVDTSTANVLSLTVGRYTPSSQSSAEYGYNSGGAGPVNYNIIDRYPFASDDNATDVGDLPVALLYDQGGSSSSENGYAMGGTPTPAYTHFSKFPFASATTNATTVGDISPAGRYGMTGTQH